MKKYQSTEFEKKILKVLTLRNALWTVAGIAMIAAAIGIIKVFSLYLDWLFQ